jgi:hypothetical protein
MQAVVKQAVLELVGFQFEWEPVPGIEMEMDSGEQSWRGLLWTLTKSWRFPEVVQRQWEHWEQ